MLTERDLKIGGKYLYWSPSKMCHTHVAYVGKRRIPEVFVFRDPLTLNEIWAENLINITIDDGWIERFIVEKEEEL